MTWHETCAGNGYKTNLMTQIAHVNQAVRL